MELIKLTPTQTSSPDNLQKWFNSVGIITIVRAINMLAAQCEFSDLNKDRYMEEAEKTIKEAETAMWNKFNKYFLEMKEREREHIQTCHNEWDKHEQVFEQSEERRNAAVKIAVAASKAVSALEDRVAELEKEINELKKQ